jgi:hypothetical protein
VSGLKDQYERLQVQLEAAAGTGDPERVVAQLEGARQAAVALRVESMSLSEQLAEARRQLEDPMVNTAAGQRIIWLTAALLVTMSMVMAMVTTWL